jgi:hypothetical protein
MGAARIGVITVSKRGRTPRAYYQQLYRTDEVQAMLASCGFEILEALEPSEVPGCRTKCRPRPAGCAPAGSLTAARTSC